jgi:hypothetical protein
MFDLTKYRELEIRIKLISQNWEFCATIWDNHTVF